MAVQLLQDEDGKSVEPMSAARRDRDALRRRGGGVGDSSLMLVFGGSGGVRPQR